MYSRFTVPLQTRPDCPKDTWFRIRRLDPVTYIVTVGIGLTRGMRSDVESAWVPADIATAVGLPSAAERSDLERREHVEFYQHPLLEFA